LPEHAEPHIIVELDELGKQISRLESLNKAAKDTAQAERTRLTKLRQDLRTMNKAYVEYICLRTRVLTLLTDTLLIVYSKHSSNEQH
jgi:hypothetical protein